MSSIQERLQLKRVPLDTWNIREQLCLASAVVRSGDQNWMSVSRALKTVGEPSRPSDWYSQKSCAAQYGALLEHVETPKRKKRNSEGGVETPQESILKKLTQERMDEIQKSVQEMNQQYEQLKNEIIEVRNADTTDERLRELWTSIEASKRARERENTRRAAWLRERDERRARAERAWRPPSQQGGSVTPGSVSPATAPPSSPLLTSLLKSSPVVTTPQHISHPANVVDTTSPSSTAPTLSMLLEKGGAVVSVASAPALVGSPLPNPAPLSAPTPVAQPVHDNKRAAIEHIKSQLVQIEHQLKANSSPPAPLPPAPPTPAVDIDDIEIKAEDVYAFSDIDIVIPPVATIHKGNTRLLDKPVYKQETEAPAVDVPEPIINQTTTLQQDIKEEPVATSETVENSEIVTEVESAPELIPLPREPASSPVPAPVSEPAPVPTAPEVKIAFPEVKFPTPEIKFIQPEEIRIKEEIKEPAVTIADPEVVHKAEILEEVIQTPTETIETPVDPPLQPVEETTESQTEVTEADVPSELPSSNLSELIPNPENIPLPPEPHTETISTEEQVACAELQHPQETEAPSMPEDTVEEIINTEEKSETKDMEQKETIDDIRKEIDNLLSKIDTKEIMEQSVPEHMDDKEVQAKIPDADVKEERVAETEDTHTETDDDTPIELSREEEKDGKKRRDYSRKKKPDSRTCSGSESAEASAPESPSGCDAERLHRLWKRSVLLVYSRLCAHKYASLFLRPITDEEAPGYSIVVKRPMDLNTIKRNIEAGVVRSTGEFQRDVLLMLSNALMYNSSEHSVYQMAKEMQEECAVQLSMLVAAQAHAGLHAGRAGHVTPGTRKRRREHHSPQGSTPPIHAQPPRKRGRE